MRKLPTYKGWTVDYKLKEFRQVRQLKDGSRHLSTRPFDTFRGDYLLGKMISKNLVPREILVELF